MLVERFDPRATLEAIRRHRVTVVTGVPTMWSACGPGRRRPTPSPRCAWRSQRHSAPAVRRAVRERFGLELAEGWADRASPWSRPASGSAPDGEHRALPGVSVRLVDGAGGDASSATPARSGSADPTCSRATGRTTRRPGPLTDDGWLRTGDVAVVDEDGCLHLVDRAKDVIVVSGFNVFPAEVEEVLEEHPAVAAAAVVGVPHPRTGEAVKAFVVPADGARVEVDDLIDHAGHHLARYKCPSTVEVVDELPTSLTGKVVRRSLR